MNRVLPLIALALAAATHAEDGPSANAVVTSNAVTPKLIAEQITAATAEQHVQRGLDAIGGIGDWALSNGILCATISDIAHESDLSTTGGALIDLGFCDRDDDQFVAKQDLRNGSITAPLDRHHISASISAQAASIMVSSHASGLLQEVRFTLDLASPQQLKISKRYRRQNDEAPSLQLLVPMLFNYHSMETFLLSSSDPAQSTGFEHVSFSSGGVRAFAAAAQPADTIVALGAGDVPPPIAYGWRLDEASRVRKTGERTTIPRFAASDRSASVFVVLSEPFTFGAGNALGTLELLQLALMGLEPGESLILSETLYVGRERAVAAITDQLYPDAPRVQGRVNEGGSAVHIDRLLADGETRPFTHAVADDGGAWSARLPAGRYRLRARGPGGRSATADVAVGTNADSIAAPDLALPTPARLMLPRGEPMRLVFTGRDGTPDPQLQPILTDYTVTAEGAPDLDDRVPMVFLAGIDSDRRSIVLPPGRYRAYATRGIEYTVTQSEFELGAGEQQALAIALPQRAVATPGLIGADLHVHSGPSIDTGFAPVERVRTFVAEHGEVMVATEHETLFDFAPLIRRMGVSDRIVTITGTEMTGQVSTALMPNSNGHANFFPLTPQPYRFRRGVPANEGRRLRDVIFDARQANPSVYAQLNHARESDLFLDAIPDDPSEGIDNGAYLDHMGPAGYPYNPRQPLTEAPNRTLIEPDPVTGIRDIDVDAMEILNGTHDYAPTRRRALLADWFSLLLQGERIAGSANSDSHNKAQQVAVPRNMVRLDNDGLEAFDPQAFLTSLRQGRFYGTTGPLLNVALTSDEQRSELGDTFSGSAGTLQIRLDRAPWVPTSELRVRVNGEIVATLDAAAAQAVPLEFQADAFVVVEAEGEPEAIYRAVLPGHRPYAFTNPIYVDADGDGRWSPPGLPSR
ncbi:MAG: CehA/McbA family metallohydrolase [Pseudomonadota bacterium]